jgi:hypothetical protein
LVWTITITPTCGQPITDKARVELQEAEEEIRADPRYQEMLRVLKKDLGMVYICYLICILIDFVIIELDINQIIAKF